nr:uncharacterized protein LOC117272972 [Nicotiana tomentosiformis]
MRDEVERLRLERRTMTARSLGLRSSGSYGSLQQKLFQNSGSPFQATPPVLPRKPPKMFKKKEGLFLWICKFAPRKKVGMLLLCVVSAAVFVWVLYVGKGEDAQELNTSMNNKVFPPGTGQIRDIESIEQKNVGKNASNEPSPPPPPAYFKGYTLTAWESM